MSKEEINFVINVDVNSRVFLSVFVPLVVLSVLGVLTSV
jgi:hypothetical protein